MDKVFHKFHAKPTEFRGRVYPSKIQARYAQQLELRKQAGEILFWLEEVPFKLPGGIKYYLDFMEFWASGEVHCVEVKGMDTPLGKLKIQQVETLYPVKIELIRKEQL